MKMLTFKIFALTTNVRIPVNKIMQKQTNKPLKQYS